MALDDRHFCRVYTDHRGSSEELTQLVARLLGVDRAFSEIAAEGMEILVDHGDNFPPIEERDYSNFINWKYSLEVSPATDDASEEEFAESLRSLLAKLHNAGVRAVPSCAFEELLAPWNWVDA